MNQPHKILFVCMGNICRSPTAEAVLRARAQQAGVAARLQIDSAGTHDYHIGEAPDKRSIQHGARRAYDLAPLRARQVVAADFVEFDWILAMDEDNLARLQRLRPSQASAQLRLFMEFAPQCGSRIVPDPYYGQAAGFELVLDYCEAAADGLLRELGLLTAGHSAQ